MQKKCFSNSFLLSLLLASSGVIANPPGNAQQQASNQQQGAVVTQQPQMGQNNQNQATLASRTDAAQRPMKFDFSTAASLFRSSDLKENLKMMDKYLSQVKVSYNDARDTLKFLNLPELDADNNGQVLLQNTTEAEQKLMIENFIDFATNMEGGVSFKSVEAALNIVSDLKDFTRIIISNDDLDKETKQEAKFLLEELEEKYVNGMKILNEKFAINLDVDNAYKFINLDASKVKAILTKVKDKSEEFSYKKITESNVLDKDKPTNDEMKNLVETLIKADDLYGDDSSDVFFMDIESRLDEKTRKLVDKKRDSDPDSWSAKKVSKFIEDNKNNPKSKNLVDGIIGATVQANPDLVEEYNAPENPQANVMLINAALNLAEARAGSLGNEFASREGLSAGMDLGKLGLWVKGFVGKSHQKEVVKDKKILTPYDGDVKGFVLGIDSEVSQGLIIGAMGSFSKSKLEYKGNKEGDKHDFDTVFGSIYAHYMYSDIAFNASVFCGKSDNKLKMKRSVGLGGVLDAKSDYKTDILGGKLGLGYVMQVADSIALIPSTSVKYTNLKTPDHDVKYDGAFNDVKIKGYNTGVTTLSGGATVKSFFEDSGIRLYPTLKVFVRHDIKNVDKVHSNWGRYSISSEAVEKSRTYLNVGGSVDFSKDMFKASIAVDANFAKKYHDVLGSLTLKVDL